jgi:hypothetical protein
MTSQDCKFDFIKATVRAEHPTWTDTQVFEQSIIQAKLGTFGRPTKSADSTLVAVASGLKDPAPLNALNPTTAQPKAVAATVPKSKGALITGGFYLPILPEEEE